MALQLELKERYSDLADVQYAKQTLCRLRQNCNESVGNFAERIFVAAAEAYPGRGALEDAVVQQTLVDIFIDGWSNTIARKLIKAKPATLRAAITLATAEQQAVRSFNLRRGEEPMEIDSLQGRAGGFTQPKPNPMTELQQQMAQLTQNVDKLAKIVAEPKKGVKKGLKKKDGNAFKWTEEGLPICGKCHRVGHYMRNCPTEAKN